MTDDANRLPVFLHVPKTAGSTLNQTLWRFYGTDGYPYVDYTPLPAAAAAKFHALPDKDAVRVFGGHFYFGTQDLLGRPTRLFSMLREPVSREVSHFHQVRRQKDSAVLRAYHDKVGAKLSMQEFFTAGFHPDLDNFQTRLLAGLDGECEPLPFGACDEQMLARAIANMDTHFDSVGLTEDYDRSVLLLRRIYGWAWPFYVQANVTPQSGKTPVPDDVTNAIRENTRFDRQLYDHAAQKFAAQVAAQGPSFETELRRFGTLNRLWTFKYRVWKLKQRALHRQ